MQRERSGSVEHMTLQKLGLYHTKLWRILDGVRMKQKHDDEAAIPEHEAASSDNHLLALFIPKF